MEHYAILYVSHKISTQAEAEARYRVNYGRDGVAPKLLWPARTPLNRDLLNPERRSYWELANQRLEAAGVGLVPQRGRPPVRLVEVVARMSYGCAVRNAEGRTTQLVVAGSKGAPPRVTPIEQWLKATLNFVQQRFGADNVVAATVHEDLPTVQLVALVVPLTFKTPTAPTPELAASAMFSAAAKPELERAYAAALAWTGLRPRPPRPTLLTKPLTTFEWTRIQVAGRTPPDELRRQLTEVPPLRLVLQAPSLLDRLRPEAWAAAEQSRLRGELAQWTTAVNARLAHLTDVAVAYAAKGYRLAEWQRELRHQERRVMRQQTLLEHLRGGTPPPPDEARQVFRVLVAALADRLLEKGAVAEAAALQQAGAAVGEHGRLHNTAQDALRQAVHTAAGLGMRYEAKQVLKAAQALVASLQAAA